MISPCSTKQPHKTAHMATDVALFVIVTAMIPLARCALDYGVVKFNSAIYNRT